MNVYLDIDGVILNRDLTPALFAHDFLQYIINNFPTYWLTTHCKGDASTAYNRLNGVLQPETMELISNVKATNWTTSKTEAINFSEPFLWFDDNLFYSERQDLITHNVVDNWIEVRLIKHPDQLLQFVKDFPVPVTH